MSDSILEGSGKTFSSEAFQEWDDHRDALQPYFQEIYAQISPQLEGAEAILDIAGGEGRTHNVLPEDISSRLTTLDIDGNALQRLKDRRPAAHTVQANTIDMPFDDETFDAAISINGIGRTGDTPEGADEEAEEIVRVLKPGGRLFFLFDLPFSMKQFSAMILETLPAAKRNKMYSLPLVNPATQNVDQLAQIHRRILKHPGLKRSTSGQETLKAAEGLLGNDWAEKIYSDQMKIATHAKLFARLVREVQSNVGMAAVSVTPALAPHIIETESIPFRPIAHADTDVGILEADTHTEDVYRIGGEAVSRLYVDELSFPHVTFEPDATSTHVRGRTPVFVVRKHGKSS